MLRALSFFMLAAASAWSQNLTLHLIATDAQGNPVADLAADDLRLTDEGKPVSIAAFRKEAPGSAAPLAAGELTNRPAALDNVHVVLFDLLNLAASDRRTSADQ